MSPICQLDHIVLVVRDVDRALEFYHSLLGMEVLRLDAFRGGKIGFPSVRVSEQTIIDLFPAAEEHDRHDDRPNMHHFCLVTDAAELEPLRGALEQAGFPAEDAPHTRWGARGDGLSFYVRDPDGNRLEIRAYA